MLTRSLLLRNKLRFLELADKLFGWLFLFTWAFGGAALATVLHKTFFLPQSVFAVLGKHPGCGSSVAISTGTGNGTTRYR
jgi:hypothetical protein